MRINKDFYASIDEPLDIVTARAGDIAVQEGNLRIRGTINLHPPITYQRLAVCRPFPLVVMEDKALHSHLPAMASAMASAMIQEGASSSPFPL